MSELVEFRPHPNYAQRCWINACIVYLLGFEIWVAPIAIWLAVDESPVWGLALLVVPTILFVVGSALYIPAWVASIRYAMTDEEIVVHKGVFGRAHKIVPYRTVTNVTTTRAWLDRLWLNIGNVHVQTAGSGGTAAAEERLVGLSNFEEIRDEVVRNLRRYRADASPSLGGGEAGATAPGQETADDDVQRRMLEELRRIRQLLESQE